MSKLSGQRDLSWLEHLEELRRRILWVAAILFLAVIGGMFVVKPIFQYLMNEPPADGMAMHAFSPWDSVGIWVRFSLLIGLFVSLPVVLYHFWAFVRPGLTLEEQKATIRYIPYAIVCFLSGLAFAYFVIFPMAFQFTAHMAKGMGLQETYGIIPYLTFMINILLPMSILFELSIIVLFLTRLRILNPSMLHKFRRVAYLILIIIAVVITPPDFISDFLVIIPLIILYEISVFLSTLVYRKQLSIPEGSSGGGELIGRDDNLQKVQVL